MQPQEFDDWWASSTLKSLETRQAAVWEESVQYWMDEIKTFVMKNLDSGTSQKDIEDKAKDWGMKGPWFSRFVKACESLKASRAPSAVGTAIRGEPYELQTDIIFKSINTDIDSVSNTEAEGLVNEAQNMPSLETRSAGAAAHSDELKKDVDTKVSFGVQVDAKSKWLDNDSKLKSVKHAYPDLDAENVTVKELKEKMSEYLFASDVESYIIYTNEHRKEHASDDAKITQIASKDENKMYTVYAEKQFKSLRGDVNQAQVDQQAEKCVTSSNILKGLATALAHVNEEIECYVAELAEIFGEFEDDPALKTLLAICRFKEQLKQNAKEVQNRQIAALKASVQEPGPDALSQVMTWSGLAGTGLGMVGGLCSLYSYYQDREISKFEKLDAKHTKNCNKWKKRQGKTPKQRALYRTKRTAALRNKAINSRKLRASKDYKASAGKFGAGCAAIGVGLQAAQMGMQIYQMVRDSKEQAKALREHYDSLVKQIKECANAFESSALIYDNLVTLLWSLRTTLQMAFKKELEEENVFGEFDDEKSKPTMATYKHDIQTTGTPGEPVALNALTKAVAQATRTVKNYLNHLAMRYTEMKTYLQSQKDFKDEEREKHLAQIAIIDKKINEAPDESIKEYWVKEKEALLAEDDEQTLKVVFESFLTYQQKHSAAAPERGTQSDLLELYYNAFIVYTFQTTQAMEGSKYTYGKYNIDPQINMDTAALEIIDKDNLLKNDLLSCRFFDPKEFDIDQYISDELIELSVKIKTLAFVRVARTRFMIFSSHQSEKDKSETEDEKETDEENETKDHSSDAFVKYSFTLLLYLMKLYKLNPLKSIKYKN